MACFSPSHRSWARSWINRSSLWRMASATLDLRLPSQQHGITSRVASPTPQRLRQHCSLVSICCITITLHYLSIFFTSVWNMRALLSGLKGKRLRQSVVTMQMSRYTHVAVECTEWTYSRPSQLIHIYWTQATEKMFVVRVGKLRLVHSTWTELS